MTVKKGKLITLEGIEGVGKTSALQCVTSFLSDKGIDYLMTREPGGTPLAEKIRECILSQIHSEPVLPLTETLLFSAARLQHVTHVIQPALMAGQWVLCDRFTDATIAYQGYGRGVDLTLLITLINMSTSGLTPDLTILLDAKTSITEQRIKSRGKVLDRIELESGSFFDRVRQGYLKIAQQNPQRCVVVNAQNEMKVVHQEIIDIITAMVMQNES